MHTISDLTTNLKLTIATASEVNPFSEDDALQEAQLLAVKFDALRGVASLLFELRMALQLREGNTGILVASGVREFAWNASERRTDRTAWSVGSSTVRTEDNLVSMELSLWPHPGARLSLVAGSAVFYEGHVPKLGETPPDYLDEDDATLQQHLATWDSPIQISGQSTI